MRYKASEKREVIELVERSSLPVRRTLDRLGIPKSTFYGWYERYREGGDAALEDIRPSGGYWEVSLSISREFVGFCLVCALISHPFYGK